MKRDKQVYYKKLDRLNVAAKRAYQLYKQGTLSLEKYSICRRAIDTKSDMLWDSVLDMEFGLS